MDEGQKTERTVEIKNTTSCLRIMALNQYQKNKRKIGYLWG